MRWFLLARLQIAWWTSPLMVYALAIAVPAVLAAVFLAVAALAPGPPLTCHPAPGTGKPVLACVTAPPLPRPGRRRRGS